MIGKVVGWLGRKAGLYVLLVAAIGVSTIVAPWARRVIAGSTPMQVRAQVLGDASRTIAAERDSAVQAFRGRVKVLRGQSFVRLDARRQELEGEHSVLREALAAARPAWVLALVDRAELLANERRKLRLAVIEQELTAVRAARVAAASDGAALAAATGLAAQQRRVDRLVRDCTTIIGLRKANESQWRWRLGRRWIETAEHKRLSNEEATCRDKVALAKRQRDGRHRMMREQLRLLDAAQAGLARAAGDTGPVAGVGRELTAIAERARVDLAGSAPERLRVWSERWGLAALLRSAARALALIVAAPFAIRLFCYFVLAPLAMRRGSIRLRIPSGRGVAIVPAAPSATSVAVRLAPGEELLVRQHYLRASSQAGAKGTQWLLDWRKPVTSVATGLTFLTRIRGDGEITTISAIRDGLAEVAVLTLPEGAACVLQPRALAAVAQPVRRRLRVTRHWRLGALDAWLTLRLRYLVFHGPARLVLKGGRGVRVEAAGKGRIFGQDQLVGFSADLAYSVTRTETFWPYFLGRQQLLKDRVMAGAGVVIVEEAPLTVRRGEGRRGLEGMVDAGMKVFGM